MLVHESQHSHCLAAFYLSSSKLYGNVHLSHFSLISLSHAALVLGQGWTAAQKDDSYWNWSVCPSWSCLSQEKERIQQAFPTSQTSIFSLGQSVSLYQVCEENLSLVTLMTPMMNELSDYKLLIISESGDEGWSLSASPSSPSWLQGRSHDDSARAGGTAWATANQAKKSRKGKQNKLPVPGRCLETGLKSPPALQQVMHIPFAACWLPLHSQVAEQRGWQTPGHGQPTWNHNFQVFSACQGCSSAQEGCFP